MNIDKIVISSKNTKAVEFFEDLNKKKSAFNKRAEAKLSKMILLKKVALQVFSDFYSFTKEEDDDIDYTFSSSINDVLYFVSFGINEYQKYLDDYPTLLQKGYSLAFQSKTYSQKRKRQDTLVFPTLYRIIEDFMKTDLSKETVLLYHCDVSDNKQGYRKKLFDNWEKEVTQTNLFKHSVEVVIENATLGTSVNYYLGFITFLENPNIELIKEEFQSFSYNISLIKS